MDNSTMQVPFPAVDNENVSIQYYNHYTQIMHCASGLYPLHTHAFFEIVYIVSGTVKHTYKDITTKLIPGDIFVIPPHAAHAYEFGDELQIYNVQFMGNIFSDPFLEHLNGFDFIQKVSDFSPYLAAQASDELLKRNNIYSVTTAQGILHLNTSQQERILNLILAMYKEQDIKLIGFDFAQQNYLELLIIEIYRILQSQIDEFSDISSQKRSMILDILNTISENLDTQIDFNDIAKQYNISPNYFRTIFKSYVGTAPIEYLNRTRVLRAAEYLRLTDLPIVDVAAQVGIYDASYFTRLFKKYLGHPPKYFKNLSD